MKIFRVFSRRTKYILSAATLVLTFIAPTLFTGFASAAELSDRSIDLSSSAKAATGVTYKVSFTGAATAGAFVIELCSDSPVIGNSCAAPAGSSIHNATIGSEDSGTDTATVNKLTADEANAIEVTDASIANGHTTVVDLDGVSNPTDAGTLYARIVTFDTEADAKAYTSEGAMTGAVDNGGVALAITDNLNVGGTVQESLTFCQSGEAITDAACTSPAPVALHLGSQIGSTNTYVLGTSLSTAEMWTQISTNAASGAVVSLKSNANDCGGLLNSSASGCFIKPASNLALDTDDAAFGIKLGTVRNNSAASDPGSLVAASGSNYNTSTFNMNFTSGANPTSGVTSPYGDAVFTTNSAPADAQSMPIIFGADASNLTPAGNYSADISLIATGTF